MLTWLGMQWEIVITLNWLIEKYDTKFSTFLILTQLRTKDLFFTSTWWVHSDTTNNATQLP